MNFGSVWRRDNVDEQKGRGEEGRGYEWVVVGWVIVGDVR